MSNAFETEIEAPETETLASLAENLVYRLPGCSDLTIRKTLQEVYRDFCRRTCCLRVRRHFTLRHGDSVFTVAPMYGGVIDCVTVVRMNKRPLICHRDYDVRSGASVAVCIAPRLVPHENADESALPIVEIEAVECPKLNSERVPSFFTRTYGEEICSGVLSRLMSMTGKAWTDAQQAADERIRYENAVNENRVRFYADNENGDLGFGIDMSGLL